MWFKLSGKTTQQHTKIEKNESKMKRKTITHNKQMKIVKTISYGKYPR